LTDDIQYILAKHPRLFRRHLIGVVLHLSIVLADKITNNLAQIQHYPEDFSLFCSYLVVG
jgi:hypothetical protein